MAVRAYCGVGSRETPDDVLDLMRRTAIWLRRHGWILRSGGAPGADTAFEGGATALGDYSQAEIYLPWPKFERRIPENCARVRPQAPEAYDIAAQFHPNWQRLSRGATALHARNVHQVLGFDVTAPEPSRFILCWTPGAKGGGGTGQAIRIARGHQIPIFDLCDPDVFERVSVAVTKNAVPPLQGKS